MLSFVSTRYKMILATTILNVYVNFYYGEEIIRIVSAQFYSVSTADKIVTNLSYLFMDISFACQTFILRVNLNGITLC